MAITKDFVADYGADNTGVASVTTKLYVNLNSDMQGQDVNLTFPAGSYNNATFGGSSWIGGALDLNVTATGATLFGSGGVFLMTPHLTQIGIDQAGGKSARIQTVSPGANSVTLTASSASAGHISRFSVDQYIMVCGWPIQGYFQAAYSFPPNFGFFEFRKITGIVGNTISFTDPLAYFYSSTWPELNRGGAFEVDAAGPASIFALDTKWNGTSSFTDGTYTNGQLINCYRENFIMTGGTSSNLPVYPSVTKLFRLINHTATAALVEHDKLCETVDIQGGTFSQWKVQSSSTHNLTMTGVTVPSINGTPGNTVLDGCTVSGGPLLGPIAYGRSDTFVAKNMAFGAVITGGYLEKGPGDGLTTDVGVHTYMSMSGGVITIPLCFGDNAVRTMMPDAAGRNVLMWQGTNGTIGSFRVLSVTSDPWPAVDNQASTVNVTMTQNSKGVQVSSAIFSSGDVGKTIIIPNATSGGLALKTFITGFTDAQNITVFSACTLSGGIPASSRALQWGTCNMYVQTDQSGGLPASGLYSGGAGKLFIYVPPVRSVRLENCTGTAQALDLSQPSAWNRPLDSYTKRVYNGVNGASPVTQMRGNLVYFRVNVTKAYTGTAPILMMRLANSSGMNVVQSGAYAFYNPRIDLKTVGERIIRIGSTTGAQPGDSGLDLSVPTWVQPLGSGLSPLTGNNTTTGTIDISGEDPSVYPSFEMEMITDQGFASESTAGARVRIRMR